MHPTISYRLAQPRIAELQRQALRDALAHQLPPSRHRPGVTELP